LQHYGRSKECRISTELRLLLSRYPHPQTKLRENNDKVIYGMQHPARRILVLTFYYSPDLSAGSFRAAALVKALLDRDPHLHVDVITTMPNRYRSFSSNAAETETHERHSITRVALPPHASGMRDQARAFFSYARAVQRLTKHGRYDLVFGTSSRLMTAVLAARVSSSVGAPLYLDIRDIFVDTIGDVMPRALRVPLSAIFAPLEKWTVQHAARVNLVSEGFRPYFEQRFEGKSFSFYTNGVDEIFERSAFQVTDRNPALPIRILYAGNIGEGQGLHSIIPQLAVNLGNRASFRVIGDGGRRKALEDAIHAYEVTTSVEVLPPVDRVTLLEEYRTADVLFLHLNDYPAFEKVLPSKIFEYAALGKPILAGVGGYAAKFLAAEVSNAAVFAPCDAVGAVDALSTIEVKDLPRQEFIARFRRETLMGKLAREVLEVAQSDAERSRG
jgi:glycosyltransferase involved in cell wall biosynthesis